MRSTFWIYISVFLLLPASLKAEPAQPAGAVDEADALACVANMPRLSTEHFIIACEDANTTYARQVAEVLESAYMQFDSAFEHLELDIHLPEGKLVWICFCEPSSFRQYSLTSDSMDLSYMSGYYSSRTNRVAIMQDRPRLLRSAILTDKTDYDPVLQNYPLVADALDSDEYTDVTRITHELAHQMAFNCGLQKRRVMYPIWVSEGLAAAFEEILYPARYLGGRNSVRLGTLARMHRQHRLLRLEEFLPMTQVLAGRQTEQEVYAQSWGLFFFLSRHRKSDLRVYLRKLATCPIGRRSPETLTNEFIASFGPISKLQEPWNAFLESLVSSPEAKTVAIISDPLKAAE